MFRTRSAAPGYPTTREKLVGTVRRNGAFLDIVELVNDLPDKNYYGRRKCPADLGNAVVVVVIGLTQSRRVVSSGHY
ncbi:DUF2795 domain-containing protein [Paraburkholderia aspalathi]|uniref:DUF2795 domain-containing protein n=1 Tax=Paraburkholderia aspalathi TaxID=1324617 RepID=UPI001FD5FC7F|nr:DUF2795 domain-containing protein [Paraburkholderia aspalathi]